MPVGIVGGVAMGSLFDPAGPALLAQEAWLMSVSLANWQMHTKPKELGRPNWPYAWQDPELAAAGVRNVTALRFGCNASK